MKVQSRRAGRAVWLCVGAMCAWAHFAFNASPAIAAPGDLLLHVPNPEGIVGARFGDSVSEFQGNILVGASNTPVDDMAFVGRAYLIDSRTGELLQTFHNPAPQSRGAFGEAVLGLADSIVIGAPGNDIGSELQGIGSGWAYVYGEDGIRAIPNPTYQEGRSRSFGQALAPYRDQFLTGVAKDVNGIANAGEAYIIHPQSGNVSLTVSNPDPGLNDLFGAFDSLATFGDRIAIGAFLDDAGPEQKDVGRVWVFNDAGDVRLTLENPAPSDSLPPLLLPDWFGFSVATVGNKIIVGAPLDDPGGVSDAGSAYVFDGLTGELLLAIPNPFPSADAEFGHAVAGVGGDILVGAYLTGTDDAETVGAAYLFDGRTGELLLEFQNPEPNQSDLFGETLTAIDGNILISAWGDDPEGLPNAGSVYLFEGFPPGDTNHDGVVELADLNNVRNSFGADGIGDLNADRIVDLEDLNLVRNNFGTRISNVPEPGSGALLALFTALVRLSLVLSRSTSIRRNSNVQHMFKTESSSV